MLQVATFASLLSPVFAALVLAIGLPASAAADDSSCSNTCVIMTIPSSSEGVHPRFDGTSDATMWPVDDSLRTIRVAALNDASAPCNVTIEDVQHDDLVHADSFAEDDAVHCDNVGNESTVQLRSTRIDHENGRAYFISLSMEDPSCPSSRQEDQMLIVVPPNEHPTTLEARKDTGRRTTSYSGDMLSCRRHEGPQQLASHNPRG